MKEETRRVRKKQTRKNWIWLEEMDKVGESVEGKYVEELIQEMETVDNK